MLMIHGRIRLRINLWDFERMLHYLRVERFFVNSIVIPTFFQTIDVSTAVDEETA